MPTVPLESEEQSHFVNWLESNSLRYTAIPNSTYTTSWSQKRRNHATGLRPGFPDLIVLIPKSRSHDGEGYFLCLEMKRRQGGAISADQKKWIDAINALGCANVQSFVVRGSTAAKKVVSHYCKDTHNSIF